MSGMSASGGSGVRGLGVERGNTALTHVELILNGCSAQIPEIEPYSADLLADSKA